MSESKNEALPDRKFARRARRSIMAINSTQQSYKQMKLRNEPVSRKPFSAGRMKYEAPKFLSTAMTPPRIRKNLKKSSYSTSNLQSSLSRHRRIDEGEAEKENITLEEFRLEPMQGNDITELPFEPIKPTDIGKLNDAIEEEEEEKENLEEWIDNDAGKFVPEPLETNPLQEALEHNDSMNEEESDEDRDILEEIKMVKQKLVGIVGSAIYLNRKIPNVEKMMQQTELYTVQDVMGTWDVLCVNIEKMIERSKNDDIPE